MATAVPPPAAKGRFFTGNLHEFKHDILNFFTRIAREHGDVVSFRLGPKRLFLVSHPDLIEQVLSTNSRNFTKTYFMKFLRPMLGNGLLGSAGDFWLRQRRLAQPAFHRDRIAAYARVMVEYTDRLIETWKPGETRDIHAEMMQLTLQIVAKTLFNSNVAEDAPEVGAAMEDALADFDNRANSLFPIPTWIPTPGNLRLKRAIRKLDRIIYGFINERRASGKDHGDLLSMLLQTQDADDGSRMTDQQLRDESMTLFLAGHETTALTLAWTTYLLCQNPEVDARLSTELRDVLGDRPPTVEDMPRLKYAEMVVQESMRLYPPAYFIGRAAIDECELGGFRVPARQTLIISQWVVHRDPRFYENADTFRPERWTDGLLKRLPKYAYIPFGGGPRICIGNTFAMMEAVLVLATLARRFRFELAPDQVVKFRPSVTLRPERGIRVRVIPR